MLNGKFNVIFRTMYSAQQDLHLRWGHPIDLDSTSLTTWIYALEFNNDTGETSPLTDRVKLYPGRRIRTNILIAEMSLILHVTGFAPARSSTSRT